MKTFYFVVMGATVAILISILVAEAVHCAEQGGRLMRPFIGFVECVK